MPPRFHRSKVSVYSIWRRTIADWAQDFDKQWRYMSQVGPFASQDLAIRAAKELVDGDTEVCVIETRLATPDEALPWTYLCGMTETRNARPEQENPHA